MAEIVNFVRTATAASDDVAIAGSHAEAAALRSDILSYRISVGFLGRRFFVAVLAGQERRSSERLAIEAQHKRWRHWLFGAALLVGFGSTMLMCTLATAYLLKSLIGVDIFDEHFPLHQLFFD